MKIIEEYNQGDIDDVDIEIELLERFKWNLFNIQLKYGYMKPY